jgi:hypothetical protein
MAGPGGVLAHWTFDQTGQAIALDSVGTLHGTLNAGATMVAGGVAGGAVQLSTAANGLVDMGPVLALTGTQPCTITAWVKLTGGFAVNSIPVSHHNAGYFNGYFLCVNSSVCYGAPAIAWSYRSNSCGGESRGFTTCNDGAWHFVAATYHPSTGNRIYVDGGPYEGVSPGTAVLANTARFLIGGVVVGTTPTNAFDGLVDDVQVYGRALTCAEINQLYNSPGSEASPITPDLNGDGEVDGADLGIMLSSWGTPAADLNADGSTDGADLGVLLSAWGVCP